MVVRQDIQIAAMVVMLELQTHPISTVAVGCHTVLHNQRVVKAQTVTKLTFKRELSETEVFKLAVFVALGAPLVAVEAATTVEARQSLAQLEAPLGMTRQKSLAEVMALRLTRATVRFR